MHNDQNQGQDRYPERRRLTSQEDHYSPGGSATLPAVSVVMPVLNEERHLAESVAAVLGQDYPGGFELVLAIGPSKDRTEAIARDLAAADDRITVVPNPSGQIASAMNAAVKTARHEILTRIDAHSMLPDDYLQTAVRALMETGAADVGGWMAAEGVTPFQRAVAWAMTSPFGVGAAANHTGGDAGPADTVYLGVYRREAIEKVGGYDETMLIAEDWELNYRIRAAGGLIWFTPELKVTYRPRATLAALAKQQFRYGRWRRVGSYLAWQVSEALVIRTKEGKATARPGDWVVEAPTGERWPVRDSQFRWSYRPSGSAPDLPDLPDQVSTQAAASSSTAPTISS